MPTGHARLMPALRRAVLVRETAERSDGELLTAFIANRDADAFAVLVRRHGPMVLGVCRRVVGDVHAADDAFQAVFLVLARRANAVRPRARVGNWLYGVAYRTAMKARAVLARRRSREKQVDAMPEPTATSTQDSWTDLYPVLDEELARLPEKLRLPMVLCDLEGRPQRSVAKQLGIAPATLGTRLASARRLLSQRLGRRGIALSGGALGMLLAERASASVVAPFLADGVVRAAEAVATGVSCTGLVSAQAFQLCEGVMRMMLLTKLKTAGVCALAALVLTGGFGLGLVPAYAGEGDKAAPKSKEAGRAATQSAGLPDLPIAPSGRDDATFLRRIFLDLTGALPTPLEVSLFIADRDPNKRTKVVDWLIADEQVKAAIAERLHLKPDQIRITRAMSENGASVRLTIVVDASPSLATVKNVSEHVTTLYDRADLVVQPRSIEIAWIEESLLGNRTKLATAWDFAFPIGDDRPRPAVGVWDPVADPNESKNPRLWSVYRRTRIVPTLVADPSGANPPQSGYFRFMWVGDSDEEFLGRVTQSARGSAPTPLEFKYFQEDQDPKKREKLLDLMLRDPAVAKKVGDDWKKKMLESPPVTHTELLFWSTSPLQPNRFEKLVDELLAANKSDDQILEAVTLATAGRLPTAEEKRATLAVIRTAADKRAAWAALARSLAGEEKKSDAEAKPGVPPAK